MARFCIPMVKIEERHVVKIKVPASTTLRPGDVVELGNLASGTANIEVYDVAAPDAVADTNIAIIPNQAFFQNSNGQRPSGNPNPGDFEYTAGQVIYAIRCATDYPFQISDDALDNTGTVAPAPNVKLVLQAGDYQLATASSAGSSGIVFNIEKTQTVPVGGNFGLGFDAANIAVIETGR